MRKLWDQKYHTEFSWNGTERITFRSGVFQLLPHPIVMFKGLCPQNFERALKSMTCVQIESIHIDGFKNVNNNKKKKIKIKMVPRCHANKLKSPKRGKICLPTGQNISSYRNSAKLNFWRYCDIIKQWFKWSISFIVHLKIHNDRLEWEQRFFIRFFSCFQKFLQFGRILFPLSHSFNSSEELLKISSE